MASEKEPAAEVCPVDHKTREAWMKHAQAQNQQTPPQHPALPSPQPASEGCDSSQLDTKPPTQKPTGGILSALSLGTQREVSTIPRAPIAPEIPSPTAKDTKQAPVSRPANNEQETAPDKTTGNWIYPSEEMFFNAMKRKSYDPKATDMQTIVPIHNAVNERAWKEIKEWERGRGSDACGGPKLASFSGLAHAPTPRARLNTLLGYQAPFDRHDWVVDRCGTKVEYVIDFYAGKNEGKALNFYLDVRPKLNSWEAVKTRMMRFVGL